MEHHEQNGSELLGFGFTQAEIADVLELSKVEVDDRGGSVDRRHEEP